MIREEGTMALIKCPECGKEISDKATICPNCGYPVSEMNKSPETEANTNQDDTLQDINFSLELELEDFCSIKASGKMMKVFYNNILLFKAPVNEFVLNYCEEESEYGKMQLKLVFSHECVDFPLVLCVNTGSLRYEKAKKFAEEIAKVYFIKDLQPGYYEAKMYAESHANKDKLVDYKTIKDKQNEINEIGEGIEKEEKFYQTEYFAIVMIFLFWPVGLFLMYKYNHFKLPTKVCLTAACLIITFSSFGLQFVKENIISKNEYLSPDSYSDIFDDGNKYVGKPIKVSGQILTVPEEDENFRYFFLTYDFHGEEQSIVVRYGLDTENFNQQDYVDIKGTVLGMAEGENIFGMSVKNLVIDAVTVEKTY